MGGIRAVLFDLDGTLSDPSEGIARSLSFALEKMQVETARIDDVRPFIGPPLQDTFASLLGTGDERAIGRAIAYYRQRYGTVGLFENRLYDGITGLLRHLADSGLRLHVATSKPAVYAGRILRRFGIDRFAASVTGSAAEGPNEEKGELIGRALRRQRIDARHALMVGDREYDILGARSQGVGAVGVLWGFGSREELESARPLALVGRPEELPGVIRRLAGEGGP
jgi:phosphoglycolate phosphatase